MNHESYSLLALVLFFNFQTSIAMDSGKITATATITTMGKDVFVVRVCVCISTSLFTFHGILIHNYTYAGH